MELKSLRDLFVHELKDSLSAEQQLVRALPKMAKAAENEELKTGFQTHLEETKRHVERLEKILGELDASTRGPKCKGMAGLIEEGDELVKEGGEPVILDAALAGAAQKVEHYEIVAYTGMMELAKALELEAAADLLQETLEEELATDEKLKGIEETLTEAGQQLVPDEA
jgi:ferritin-like metal-binding protein YciE